jgi:hypothetical protein
MSMSLKYETSLQLLHVSAKLSFFEVPNPIHPKPHTLTQPSIMNSEP